MRAPRRALLLIGSPKTGRSASRSLGEYLMGRLEKRGVETETVLLTKALRSADATEAWHASVARADLLVLAFPLYVDCLPAPVTRALELIAERRAAGAPAGERGACRADPPAFVAIAQSGFPETSHNAVALRICRSFAGAAGFAWAGGLAMGGGGVISGETLAGGSVRNQMRALGLAADALAVGEQIPDEAVRLMGKLPIPAFVYRLMGDRGWQHLAKANGVKNELKARPFASGG